MMGHVVCVTLTNGMKYEGILDVRDPLSGSTALKMAKQIFPTQPDQTTKQYPHLNILGKDIVCVRAAGLRHSKLLSQQLAANKSFQTDTTISGQKGPIRERKLEKWTAEPQDAPASQVISELEGS